MNGLGRRRLPAVLALAVLWLALCVGGSGAAALPATRLPLRFHVVQEHEQPVVSAEFLHERLARANLIFAPYAVAFVTAGPPLALPARHAVVESRSDRDAFARHLGEAAIHCFVVRTLVDVDEPPRPRRGVHWRARGAGARAHFVILSSIAEPDVLAHELGHYLGNPEHSEVEGNLMSYRRGAATPILDALQIGRMRARLRVLLGSGELRPAATGPDAAAPEPGLKAPASEGR